MRVRMMGEFRVTDAAGNDCTPRGSKARALVALLCRTPGHRRPRRWLMGKLWSDRGAEQASGSLRQALTELRRALGPLAGQLESDRDCVALVGATVDLDDEPTVARAAAEEGREFLEGLDVADPAFASWLQEERARVADQLRPANRPRPDAPIRLRLGDLPQDGGPGFARDLGAAIARLTAEYLLTSGPTQQQESGAKLPHGLDLQLHGDWSADGARLRVRLVALAGQQTLWSQRLVATRNGGPAAVIFEPVEAA
jgi:hypothetical protein